MQIVWLLIDVVAGVVLAGLVAPFTLRAAPASAHGPVLLLVVAAVCVVVVSLLRQALVGPPGNGQKGQSASK